MQNVSAKLRKPGAHAVLSTQAVWSTLETLEPHDEQRAYPQMETSAAGHLSEQIFPSDESLSEHRQEPATEEKFLPHAQDENGKSLEAPGTQTHFPYEKWLSGLSRRTRRSFGSLHSLRFRSSRKRCRKAKFKNPGAHLVFGTQPSWSTFGTKPKLHLEHLEALGKRTWSDGHLSYCILLYICYCIYAAPNRIDLI
ncbi:Hypothetical_protein [Hexamita inflata]|uniref:Hypothetical_protein n=1 Tax=Hexamita inflata TaxID=28002 RepID=A0AA86TY91_9EUKA|nr:Hypothetical protein HINF_LOCUS20581 [Hexamita inflata]